MVAPVNKELNATPAKIIVDGVAFVKKASIKITMVVVIPPANAQILTI